MWRSIVTGLGLAVALSAAAAPASAQDHAVSFNIGYFALRGSDSRVEGDVLNANRCIDSTSVCEPLLFDVDDFNNVTFGGEWLVGLGNLFEAGAGVAYYQRTKTSPTSTVPRLNRNSSCGSCPSRHRCGSSRLAVRPRSSLTSAPAWR